MNNCIPPINHPLVPYFGPRRSCDPPEYNFELDACVQAHLDMLRQKEMVKQRKWDLRFIELAKHVSQWSKDNSTKVGAVIVDERRRVVSVGYNGFPLGTDDDEALYADRDTKLSKIVHGEINALTFANKSTEGCTLYTYPFGCCDRCAGIVIQHGIKRVVFHKTDVERWIPSIEKAKKYFLEANVEVTELGVDK